MKCIREVVLTLAILTPLVPTTFAQHVFVPGVPKLDLGKLRTRANRCHLSFMEVRGYA